ncbi:MAG: NifB/NifX family molybdenum-iron cluster-binding protein [bacterium]
MDKVKIAIPSDNGKSISPHFGRCRYFIIYEIEGNRISSRTVRENLCCPHRANICPKTVSVQTREFIERIRNEVVSEIRNCQLLIGRYMNQSAINNLNSQNIKVILVDEKDENVAIEKYLMGILVETQNQQLCMCCKANCLKI